MAVTLTHAEVEELLGAYALDAVDGEEAIAVRDHLPGCPRCRAEVAEHREVAALLAHGGSDAPPALWDRIVSSIEGIEPTASEVAPPRVLFSPPARRSGDRRRAWYRGPAAPIAAVAAAVIALLGIQVVNQGSKIDDQGDQIAQMAEDEGLRRAFQTAAGDPDAHLVALRSADGAYEAPAVVRGSTGYLRAESLPELSGAATYQLWAVVADDRRISIGVLGPRPTMVRFQLIGEVVGLAVTQESAPGVVVTEQVPFVSADMPTDA